MLSLDKTNKYSVSLTVVHANALFLIHSNKYVKVLAILLKFFENILKHR